MLVVLVLNVFFYKSSPADIPIIRYLSVRWLALIPLLVGLELIRRYNDDMWVFSGDSITHYRGRYSLAYQLPSIRYAHIRAITVRQGLVGRICNYGSIDLGTAGKEGNEITLIGIVAPRKLAQLLEDLRDYSRSQAPKGDGSASAADENISITD